MNEYLSFYVQRYFMSYLMKQHNYGANTISSYRDTFRLLLAFMAESHTDISKIEIYDISHERVLEFMTWLAEVRKNGVSTKNVRLAHIKSFFRYVMMTAPYTHNSEYLPKLRAASRQPWLSILSNPVR